MKQVAVNVYSFSELDKNAQFEAIKNEIDFHVLTEDRDGTIVVDAAKKMDDLQTPWFLHQYLYDHHKQFFIDCIEANGDRFTKDGKIFTP